MDELKLSDLFLNVWTNSSRLWGTRFKDCEWKLHSFEHGFVSVGYSPQWRNGQLFSIEGNGPTSCWTAENKEQEHKFHCPQWRQISSWKSILEREPKRKSWSQCTGNFLERTMFAMRFVQLHARCKQKRNREKKKIPFSVRNEKTLGRGGCQRERTQKYQSVREVEETGLHSFLEGAMPKGIHMRLLAPIRMLTQHIQQWVNKWWDTFAFKHTGKAGEEKHCKETVAIKFYARKEFNCVLDGGHATTFSERPTSREIAWTPTKQFRVRYFRNGERHVRSRKREQDHRKEIFTKDTETIAIRTLLLTRICINSGLTCEEQARVAAWDLHKHMYKILGTYQENKDILSKTKTVTGGTSQTEICHEETEFTVDSGTSTWRKIQFGNRKILYDYFGDRVNVYDRKVTVFSQQNGHVDHGLILENSLVRLSLGKLCEETEKDKITPHIHCMSEHCVPIVILGVRVSGKTTTHIGPTCANQLQVWIFVPMETASRGPSPTTSWDREQNLSDWLKPFTERIGRRRIWIIRECWKPFPKHLPPPIPARHSNKSGGKHNLFTHFPKDPNCNIGKHNHEGSVQKESWKSRRQVLQATSFRDTVTADHKI